MPTRRTVSLLTITQPEQSGGARQAQSLSRDSAGFVLDREKSAPPLAAKLRGK
jgi:hypothetical protein